MRVLNIVVILALFSLVGCAGQTHVSPLGERLVSTPGDNHCRFSVHVAERAIIEQLPADADVEFELGKSPVIGFWYSDTRTCTARRVTNLPDGYHSAHDYVADKLEEDIRLGNIRSYTWHDDGRYVSLNY